MATAPTNQHPVADGKVGSAGAFSLEPEGRLREEAALDPEGTDEEPIAMTARAGRGGQLVALHMSPPTLGPMSVVLIVTERGLDVQFAAEDEVSVDAIKGMTGQLRRSLAELWDVRNVAVVRRPPAAAPPPAAAGARDSKDDLADGEGSRRRHGIASDRRDSPGPPRRKPFDAFA